MKLALTACLLLAILRTAESNATIYPAPSIETPQYWIDIAKQDLRTANARHHRVYNTTAKNAILFIGDGMGMTTVTAGRILKGQLAGTAGEEAKLNFETFPHTALLKTYNTDMQTSDSAGTSIAYLCGVKAKTETLGVNQHVITKNCSSYNSEQHNVNSFLTEALAAGKSVGLITTTRITHASPGGSYAHTVDRDWEDDTERNKDVKDEALRRRCPDIAQQLVDNASGFHVIFGGGRLKFLPNNMTTVDRVNGNRTLSGSRSDGVNLITQWKIAQGSRRYRYIETRDELMSLDPANLDSVLGLFAPSHLQYDLDNQENSFKEPTLAELTSKAIDILKKNPKGFALFVEGGRIDHGHHDNKAKLALHDVISLEAAVKVAMDTTAESETLLVVTADHSHVFSVGGWAGRGNSIFGRVQFSYTGRHNAEGDALGDDGLPYTSLYYGDGPSAPVNASRTDLTGVDTESKAFTQPSIVKYEYESHGSEDVPVYARGPGSHLLHSTHEQSYLGNLFKYTLCVGNYKAENNCPADGGDVSAGVRMAPGNRIAVAITAAFVLIAAAPFGV